MTPKAVDRRGFIRNASAFAAAGVGCLSFGGVGDVLGLAGRLRMPSQDVLRAVSRPFNMLAFGDSIMWGQGLTHNLKFATLVKDWVGANLPGRVVTFETFAHSGARITPQAQDGDPGWEGEVPAPYPSIHRQLSRAQGNPAEIDLVLLNGGANDIGLLNILGPWASSGSVGELTRDSITGAMNHLLSIAAGLFPNAKFVVPGYYPIITDDSSTQEVTGLLAFVLGPLGLVATPAVKQQLTANCRAFYTESDAALRNAVAAQHGRTPNRCVYADPGFSMYNGYGASQRCLFNIGESDPMATVRKANCWSAGQGSDPLCLGASMGHPNAAGAVKYANAMTSKLGGFLNEWQGLRTLFACVDPKPAIGVAGSYTVWVEDAATRLPVAANVSVGTRTVNANTSFTHTFECTAPETETLDGPRGRPGRTITRRGACDRIIITAPGYIQLPVSYSTA
ncbi:MAG: SGNH/GDSL hydrolase family protein [Gemmatimonadota bacterium]|nr:SGNH/GDSL hydrolase family protein [Gemmatimonadota bacterium]